MSKALRIAIASGKGGTDKTTVKERLPSELLQVGRRKGLEELVVINGKGGTGKTSIVASFFALAEQGGVTNCDVDAADLHLVLSTDMQQRWPFVGGETATAKPTACRHELPRKTQPALSRCHGFGWVPALGFSPPG